MTAVLPVFADVNTVGEAELAQAPRFADPDASRHGQVERDQWRRPLITPPEGGDAVPYTRASTQAGYLTDGSALRIYQTRGLALSLARHPDLLALIATLDPDGQPDTPEGKATARAQKRTLDDIIDTALDRAGLTVKANHGTAVHALTDPGAKLAHVPPHLLGDVNAYRDVVLGQFGITIAPEDSEVFVVNDTFKVSGTADGRYLVPGWGYMVGDKKTGQHLHPQQHAVQLAAYAGGERYNPAEPDPSKRRTPFDVRQDVGLLIHLPKDTGTCDLYLIDLELGRASLALAEQVREARKAPGLCRVFADVEPYPEGVNPSTGEVLDDALEDVVAVENDGSVDADLAAGAGRPLDVNGNPVDLRHDGFDDLRVTDPLPIVADTSTARGIIAEHLGGRELTLPEQVATANSREELNRLFTDNRARWSADLDTLARTRAAVLGGA